MPVIHCMHNISQVFSCIIISIFLFFDSCIPVIILITLHVDMETKCNTFVMSTASADVIF